MLDGKGNGTNSYYKHDLAFHVRSTTRRKGAFYIFFYTRANSKVFTHGLILKIDLDNEADVNIIFAVCVFLPVRVLLFHYLSLKF